MNSFYTFWVEIGEKRRNALTCYVASYDFDLERFIEVVVGCFDRRPFSQELIIITPKYNRQFIREKLLENEDAQKSLKVSINNFQKMNFHGIYLDSSGEIDLESAPSNAENILFKKNVKSILEEGIVNIIIKRRLVMESAPNFHFVKPSGKHSDKFIRAANVLEVGSEISFLAANALSLVDGCFDRVYTDTAGIFPFAYELIEIVQRLKGQSLNACVDSFGSYQNLDYYQFAGNERALVIISASTSNDMVRRLKTNVGLSRAKIITLFSSSFCVDEREILVPFKRYYERWKHSDFGEIKSLSGHECDICVYGESVPLSLSNSQFVYEAPKSETYLPKAADSTGSIKRLVSQYKDIDAFKCLYDGLGGSKSPAPEYFVDVSALAINSKNYQSKVRNLVLRSFPLNADVIVHANDQGASDVAECIRNEVARLRRKIKVCSIGNVGTAKPCRGLVVVAGSIESGKSLLDISRELRQYSSLPLTYIVGFAKYNDYEGYAKLKRDLEYNSGNPDLGNHRFFAIEEVMLPISEHRIDAWERELNLLNSLKGIPSNTEALTAAINQREIQLKSANSRDKQGIGDTLFLSSPTGKKMILGPTFAFWSDEDNKIPFSHHGTIYYTVSSILQSLRYSRTKAAAAPLEKGYIIKQLDPLIFDRFNEGVIQASVLRSAKSQELDFSADDTSSAIVGTLIERMVRYPSDSASEALPEFLLALCTKKLQVKPDHVAGIKNCDLDRSAHPLTSLLLIYARHRLFGEPFLDIDGKTAERTIQF